MDLTKRGNIKYTAVSLFIFAIALVSESFAQQPPGQPWMPRLVQQQLYGPHGLQKRLLAQKIQASKPVTPPPVKSKCGPTTCDELVAKARRQGSVNVIVGFNIPNLPNHSRVPEKDRPTVMREREAAIRQAQDALLQRMSAHKIRVGVKFKLTPGMAITVDAATLADLIADPDVVSIGEDIPMRPMLNQSVPLIGADQAWANSFSGSGYMIAILDTGIDSAHPFFAGKVAAEACFSGTTVNTVSLCPSGQTSEYGSGAAVPCGLSGCNHGTHVAGIAAGHSYAPIAFSGVAKDADLLAIQVFSPY